VIISPVFPARGSEKSLGATACLNNGRPAFAKALSVASEESWASDEFWALGVHEPRKNRAAKIPKNSFFIKQTPL
jgi:hypothetical protein